jgi:ferredoxin
MFLRVLKSAIPLAFVSQGECLPCCCQPVGAIKLDIRKG